MEAILLKVSFLAYLIGTIAGAAHLVRPGNFVRAAASSIAKGMPSRRWQI